MSTRGKERVGWSHRKSAQCPVGMGTKAGKEALGWGARAGGEQGPRSVPQPQSLDLRWHVAGPGKYSSFEWMNKCSSVDSAMELHNVSLSKHLVFPLPLHTRRLRFLSETGQGEVRDSKALLASWTQLPRAGGTPRQGVSNFHSSHPQSLLIRRP